MKKQVFGRKFKRDTNERKALFKSLLSELVLHERITTTEEKAKAVKGKAEKLVTRVKKNGSLGTASSMQRFLSSEAIKKLASDIAPRFMNRPGGYTRLVKLGRRFSDNAAMVIMEWVETGTSVVPQKTSPKTKKETKSAKVEKESVEKTAKIKKEDKKKEVKKETRKTKGDK